MSSSGGSSQPRNRQLFAKELGLMCEGDPPTRGLAVWKKRISKITLTWFFPNVFKWNIENSAVLLPRVCFWHKDPTTSFWTKVWVADAGLELVKQRHRVARQERSQARSWGPGRGSGRWRLGPHQGRNTAPYMCEWTHVLVHKRSSRPQPKTGKQDHECSPIRRMQAGGRRAFEDGKFHICHLCSQGPWEIYRNIWPPSSLLDVSFWWGLQPCRPGGAKEAAGTVVITLKGEYLYFVVAF